MPVVELWLPSLVRAMKVMMPSLVVYDDLDTWIAAGDRNQESCGAKGVE